MPELKKCPLCGDTVEFEIDFPTFDGTGKTVKRIVPKRCACSLKKEEELKQQMELYNRKREVERLRSLSLIDAKPPPMPKPLSIPVSRPMAMRGH